MNEIRPSLHLVPPPDHTPGPDYSRASAIGLRVAQGVHIARHLSADLGHVFIKASLIAKQAGEQFDGTRRGRIPDWSLDPHGVDPALDQREREAKRHLAAIRDELALRRATR